MDKVDKGHNTQHQVIRTRLEPATSWLLALPLAIESLIQFCLVYTVKGSSYFDMEPWFQGLIMQAHLLKEGS